MVQELEKGKEIIDYFNFPNERFLQILTCA